MYILIVSLTIIYEYYQTTDIKWYFDRDKWKKLNSIGVVKKSIFDGIHKKPKKEIRYYISSLKIDIELFSKAIKIIGRLKINYIGI